MADASLQTFCISANLSLAEDNFVRIDLYQAQMLGSLVSKTAPMTGTY